MANKWLEALKAKENTHNTAAALRETVPEGPSAGGEIDDTPKNPLAKITKFNDDAPSKNGHTPEKPLAKIAKNTLKPKKRIKKKKLTPEEEEAHRAQLAKDFPEYIYTEERA